MGIRLKRVTGRAGVAMGGRCGVALSNQSGLEMRGIIFAFLIFFPLNFGLEKDPTFYNNIIIIFDIFSSYELLL